MGWASRLLNVLTAAHTGLKSDIATCPKSAMSGSRYVVATLIHDVVASLQSHIGRLRKFEILTLFRPGFDLPQNLILHQG
jgi:hypothetical protein